MSDYNEQSVAMKYLLSQSKEFVDFTRRRTESIYRHVDDYNAKKKHTEHVMHPHNINVKRIFANETLRDIKEVQANLETAAFNVERYKNILDNMDMILPRAETLRERSNTLAGLCLTAIEDNAIIATDPVASAVIENARASFRKGGKTKTKKRQKRSKRP